MTPSLPCCYCCYCWLVGLPQSPAWVTCLICSTNNPLLWIAGPVVECPIVGQRQVVVRANTVATIKSEKSIVPACSVLFRELKHGFSYPYKLRKLKAKDTAIIFWMTWLMRAAQTGPGFLLRDAPLLLALLPPARPRPSLHSARARPAGHAAVGKAQCGCQNSDQVCWSCCRFNNWVKPRGVLSQDTLRVNYHGTHLSPLTCRVICIERSLSQYSK